MEAGAGQKTESSTGGQREEEKCGDSSDESDDLQGIKCQAPLEEVHSM